MQNYRSNLNLKVEYFPIDKVRAAKGNPRKHGASQIAMIAASMHEHGNLSPLLVDEKLELIAGHGRLEAARLAGFTKVPAIRLRHLSDAQKRLYRIADNRLAELSSWSVDDLVTEFASIELAMPAMDLQLSGFTMDAIDGFRDAADTAAAEDSDDEISQRSQLRPVTRIGDIWAIGEHRLICGDATAAETYLKLLSRERPAMVFTDPPYNLTIANNVSGLGKNKHREFVQASGEMSDAEFQQFLLAFIQPAARFSKPGSLHYICMDWRHLSHLLSAGTVAYDELINLCVWAKTNAGMGSLYRSAHELVVVFKKGKAGHRNNVKLGSAGRHRTNVWSYAGMTVPTKERSEALALHPTVKPVALVRDAILDVTARGDLVLDPFGGSGTTLVAAHRIGRVARLIELDPIYCDVILQRASKALKVEPVLLATGESFSLVAEIRSAEAENVQG